MKKKNFRDFEFSLFYQSELSAYIRSVGHFNLHDLDCASCRVVPFCELFWCIAGKGYFEYNGKRYLLREGDVWYYPPGSRHLFYPEDHFFHYRWFTIAGKSAPALFESVGILPGLRYGGKCPEDLFAKLELLIRHSTQNKRLQQLAVGFEILCKAASGVKRKRPVNNYILEARNMIDHDFSNPELNIQTLADILHVNRVQLSRDFSVQYGVTISAYLRNLRVQKGIELLRESDLSVKEIAEVCGYTSADYFGKVISTVTGKIPSQHRLNAKSRQ